MALDAWMPFFLSGVIAIVYLLIGLLLALTATTQESWHHLRKWRTRGYHHGVFGVVATFVDVFFWPLVILGILLYTMATTRCWTRRSDGEKNSSHAALLTREYDDGFGKNGLGIVLERNRIRRSSHPTALNDHTRGLRMILAAKTKVGTSFRTARTALSRRFKWFLRNEKSPEEVYTLQELAGVGWQDQDDMLPRPQHKH
ncbi:hypothetical protein LQW54_002642 [Pestalotiopsis sp. IQ-011]